MLLEKTQNLSREVRCTTQGVAPGWPWQNTFTTALQHIRNLPLLI